MRFLISAVLFTLCLYVGVNANCILETPDGNIDASRAASSKGYYELEIYGTPYYINICKAATGFAGADTAKVKDAIGYVKEHDYTEDKDTVTTVAGTDTSTIKVALNKAGDNKGGITITHEAVTDSGIAGPSGERTLLITLTCDESATATEEITEATASKDYGDYPKYTINVKGKSKAACPNKSLPGPSGNLPLGQYGIGGLIITLLFAGLVLYFIVGALINKFKFKKEGAEIIPQKDFWKDLPLLIKDGALFIGDGVMFVVNKARGKPTVYENV